MKFLTHFFFTNLFNNKLSWLNITGLILGMFTFLFIFFYVYTETNYDQFLPHSGEIYHLEQEVEKNGTSSFYSCTPIPLGETIYDEVAGIESYATFCSIFETAVLIAGDKDFLNPSVLYVKPGFLKTFQYASISGNLDDAEVPGKMIITQSAAKKYFGTTQAVGKTVRLLHDKKEPLDVTVAAVILDIPYNSNIQFEIICSMDDYLRLIGKWVDSWYIIPSQSYFRIKEGSDLVQVKHQIDAVVNKYMNTKSNIARGITKVHCEKISEKHFSKDFTMQHPTERFVRKSSLDILFLVGLITLIISWLNYINFLNFQNTRHFKEIGIRKINGASRIQLIFSLLKESFLLTVIPVTITLFLFSMIAPSLYKVFHFHSMESVKLNFGLFWTITLGMMFLGSILSSVLPILKLTRFQPIEMVQCKLKHTSPLGENTPVILTIQFLLSIIMICGILGINLQMKFIDQQNLGFTKENVLVLAPPVTSDVEAYNKKMELFKNEASHIPGVMAMTASSSIPGKKMVTEHFGLKNREETINKYQGLSTDGDYFKVVNTRFLAGRDFCEQPELRKNEIIINKSLAQNLGFQNPEDAINQATNYGESLIIGVVDDYHHTSLQENVRPTLFKFGLDRLAYFMIKFKGKINIQQLAVLKNKWESTFPDNPFEYTYLEATYDQQYSEEKQLSKVVLFFSFLSVFIMVLGLIGSCLNNTYKRTKEIGIRKVNGAKISEILTLLNKDFAKWVAIAFLIAIPVAWYVMNKWLESFAYKTKLSWWIYLLAGTLVLGIAILTVSWQSWSAAKRNPVEALRYE